MNCIEKIRAMLMKELEELADRGKMTACDLDNIYKILNAIKCMDKIDKKI